MKYSKLIVPNSIILLLSFFLMQFFPIPSFAASFSTIDCTNTKITNYDYKSGSYCPPTINQTEQVAVLITETILAVAIIIFFFMLILNGFNFLTSQGEPEAIAKTRKGLMFTVIGFALVLMSFTIISIISAVTGLNEGITFDSSGNIHINLITTFTATPIPAPPK